MANINPTLFKRELGLDLRGADLPSLTDEGSTEVNGEHPPANMQVIIRHRPTPRGLFMPFYKLVSVGNDSRKNNKVLT